MENSFILKFIFSILIRYSRKIIFLLHPNKLIHLISMEIIHPYRYLYQNKMTRIKPELLNRKGFNQLKKNNSIHKTKNMKEKIIREISHSKKITLTLKC